MSQAETERALILGILANRLDLDTANHLTSLEPEAFIVPVHRTAWAGMQAIVEGGGLIDSWSLQAAMRKLGTTDQDLMQVDDLFARSEYSACDLKPRVAAVSEAYKRRTLARAMAAMSEAAETEDLASIESRFAELAGKVSAAGNPRLRVGTDYAKQFERFLDGKAILPPEHRENLITFGIRALDDLIVCNPGRLIVIGGLPSAGKTALAIQAAAKTAAKGSRVVLGSLEMDEDEISARIVAHACGQDSLKVLRHGGGSSAEDRAILGQIRRHLVGLHGCAGDTWTAIEAAIIRENQRARLKVAIVDYLQLLEAPEVKGRRNDSEASRIGEITKAAKRLAQRLGINVVMLSQFNREVQEGQEPTLQHFLGSGQIERDVDVALLLWNTQPKFEGAEPRSIKCRIAKNRGGKRWGLVKMTFQPDLNRFFERVEETDPEPPKTKRRELGK